MTVARLSAMTGARRQCLMNSDNTSSTASTATPSPVQIIPVTTVAEQEWFLDVPAVVYANDPNWVPPLRSSIAKQFASTNPFFQYGQLQQFLAVRREAGGGSRPPTKPLLLGRIVAAVNHRLVDREGQKIGLFGYFECVPDFSVAKSLLDAACQWLREQGMTSVRGPINLSTHNSCLFLVDGFDSPPMMMMPYN